MKTSPSQGCQWMRTFSIHTHTYPGAYWGFIVLRACHIITSWHCHYIGSYQLRAWPRAPCCLAYVGKAGRCMWWLLWLKRNWLITCHRSPARLQASRGHMSPLSSGRGDFAWTASGSAQAAAPIASGVPTTWALIAGPWTKLSQPHLRGHMCSNGHMCILSQQSAGQNCPTSSWGHTHTNSFPGQVDC